ncbi:hypothetical protein PM082_004760 [Marasmius tenuissimus]|nr:hypothetical protein PM082_004760 [Marasmius tenuissimus]
MRRSSSTIQNDRSGSGPQNNNNAEGIQNNYFGNHLAASSRKFMVSRFHWDKDLKYSIALKSLLDAVADVGASHNAEQQYSRGECLEGTRIKALDSIWKWMLAQEKESPILWLMGTAGVGKTTIAMTIAKAFEQERHLSSSFFFFRTDPKRNVPDAVVLSIARGLISTVPLMRYLIKRRISRNPEVLKATLEDQLRKLVLKPTRHWRWLKYVVPFHVPNIVIIDGLDECGDDETQLRILNIVQTAVQQPSHFPLRFLLCSRPEGWIQEAFAAPGSQSLSKLSKVISLDGDLRSDEDIMLYYRHHFQEIVSSGQYRQVFSNRAWPTEEELNALVCHSCSQFVYAATVVGFIKNGDDPAEQLDLILNKWNSPRQPETSPYRELDRLYDIILGAATKSPEQREELHLILAAILILPESKLSLDPTPVNIQLLLGLFPGRVNPRLWGMHSVLKIGTTGSEAIRLHHTSFRDYLFDQARSGRFHINIDTETYNIARRWLQNFSIKRTETCRYEFIVSLHSLDSGAFSHTHPQLEPISCRRGPFLLPKMDILLVQNISPTKPGSVG